MHDLLKRARGRTTGSYDVLLSAAPCKGFSGANGSATGMRGKDDALIEAATTIMRKVKENNPRLKVPTENVRLDKRLTHRAKEQDELFGMEFKEIAASDQGTSQLPIRRVATTIVDIGKMRHKKAVDPNALLGQLSAAKDRDTPCIMAARSNRRKPVIVKDKDRRRRLALNEDKETPQGYPV